MSKRIWSNLEFILTDTNTGETLRLGEGSKTYPSISSDEALFNALQSFTVEEDEGRTIPIKLLLRNMNETAFLNAFLNPKRKYNLQVIRDGLNYYTQCTALEPEPAGIDDLYGDSQKGITYTVNLQLLASRNYFESDPISSNSVGSQLSENFMFGVSYPLDMKQYIFSVKLPIQPVVVNNQGGDNIGFTLTITPQAPLINPILRNETTGLEMKIFIRAEVGDTLIIDTRDKTVSLNGVYYENVKRIQDNWLKLELGNNTLKFDADTGGGSADAYIVFRNKYRGF